MPVVGGKRLYATHTKLGKLMWDRGLRAVQVAAGSGVNPRLLSDYTSGRRGPTPDSLRKLTAYFGVPREAIVEARYPWTIGDAERAKAVERAKSQTQPQPQETVA